MRHATTAMKSKRGQGIQAAISEGTLQRDELWVTSKLWNTYHKPEHVRPACEKTLADLKMDYLDLYHVHFPISLTFVPFEERYPPGWFHDPDAPNPSMSESPVPMIETWQAMTELVDAGLVRNVGVCNFGTSLLRDLMASSPTKPSCLQIELPSVSHPRKAHSAFATKTKFTSPVFPRWEHSPTFRSTWRNPVSR